MAASDVHYAVHTTLQACGVTHVHVSFDGTFRVYPEVNGTREVRAIIVEGQNLRHTSEMARGFHRIGIRDLWMWMCGVNL